MQNVTDRVSNPFGLVIPDRYAGETGPAAVYGFGDANADFHLIGDRPSVHGGTTTGVPFTDSLAGRRLQRVLRDVGLLRSDDRAAQADDSTGAEDVTAADAAPDGGSQPTEPASDRGTETASVSDASPDPTRRDAEQSGAQESGGRGAADSPDAIGLSPRNLYLSYVFPGIRPQDPSPDAYADLERYFDAELRAINAHILMPVGPTAIDHVLEAYTTQRRRFPAEIDDEAIHATEVRGRGFLVVPIREPAEWSDADERTLVDRLTDILGRDYRQTKGVATLVG